MNIKILNRLTLTVVAAACSLVATAQEGKVLRLSLQELFLMKELDFLLQCLYQ
mgnify:CR=1 FL=1